MEIYTGIAIMFLAACFFFVAHVLEKLHTRIRRLEMAVLILERRVLELEGEPR